MEYSTIVFIYVN